MNLQTQQVQQWGASLSVNRSFVGPTWWHSLPWNTLRLSLLYTEISGKNQNKPLFLFMFFVNKVVRWFQLLSSGDIFTVCNIKILAQLPELIKVSPATLDYRKLWQVESRLLLIGWGRTTVRSYTSQGQSQFSLFMGPIRCKVVEDMTNKQGFHSKNELRVLWNIMKTQSFS